MQRIIEAVPSAVLAKDNEGYTPLHLAAIHHQTTMMDILRSNGADLYELDPKQNSALHWLAPHFVLVCYDDDDSMTSSVSEDTVTYFQSLVVSGLDINQANSDGQTAIFCFMNSDLKGGLQKRRKYTQLLQVFVDSEANLSHADANGENVLHLLAKQDWWYSGKKQVLFERLMELGVNPRQENKKLQTAIDIASATNNYRVLRLFSPEHEKAEDTASEDGSCDSKRGGCNEEEEEDFADEDSEPGYEVIATSEVGGL